MTISDLVIAAQKALKARKFLEAENCLRHALRIEPGNCELYNFLGNVLAEQGKFDEAKDSFLRANSINSAYIEPLYNLGAVLKYQGRFLEAFECCQKILVSDPENASVYDHAGNLLALMGRMNEAFEFFRRAIQYRPDFLPAYSDLLLNLNYVPSDRAELFQQHRQFGEILESKIPRGPAASLDFNPPGKIRIGYLSGDFRRHAVASFIEGIFAHHDKNHFEIYCYSNSKIQDETTARLKAYVDHWRDISQVHDDHAGGLIRADRVHILVDLSGHTAGNRLSVLAGKPAPIQVSWIGYPNTNGLSSVDYKITDSYFCPSGAERFYTEDLVYIPKALSFRPDSWAPPINDLPALSGRPFHFGSFNNIKKLGDDVFRVWGRILSSVPHSRLMMLVEGNASFHDSVRDRMRSNGIQIGQVEMVGSLSDIDYHRFIQNVDLALDPFPYCGTTTTANCLWMGVPVVTLEGDSECARASAALQRHIGLDDFVARSEETYCEIALSWVGRLAELQAIRLGLREKMKDDAAQVTSEVESAYRKMIRKKGHIL